MKSYFREGEEVLIECHTDIPVQGGSLQLVYMKPTVTGYNVVTDSGHATLGSTDVECRRPWTTRYSLETGAYPNNTLFKCQTLNYILESSKETIPISFVTKSPGTRILKRFHLIEPKSTYSLQN